jgi:hypothetical protein
MAGCRTETITTRGTAMKTTALLAALLTLAAAAPAQEVTLRAVSLAEKTQFSRNYAHRQGERRRQGRIKITTSAARAPFRHSRSATPCAPKWSTSPT